MTAEMLRLGKQSEARVVTVAQKYGIEARLAFPWEDGRKIDAVIRGLPFQISTTGKSKGEIQRLTARGIGHIVAGQQVDDQQVIFQILKQLEI